MTGRRERKARARKLVGEADLAGLAAWARTEPGLLRLLSGLIYDPDQAFARRAVAALGAAAATVGEGDPELVRRVVRDLFWAMSEESGGCGHRAPEAIAEILFHLPVLLPEYGRLLLLFLQEEPFVASALRAAARLAPLVPELVRERGAELKAALAHTDPERRADAARALALSGPRA